MYNKEKVAYLRAESSLLMKVAVHEVTIFSGCDFTPRRKQAAISKLVNYSYMMCFTTPG